MFSLVDLLWLILVFAAGMTWLRHDSFRRRALALAREACDRADVQLLDETVGLRRVRLVRDDRGWPSLRRSFVFEFSRSGTDRYRGVVRFTGNHADKVDLDMAHPWFIEPV